MSINGIGGAAGAYTPIARTGANSQQGGRKTASDVLESLREMMPGWTISTSTADWGAGARNIQIDADILQRMAEDPREMERVKAMVREFESAVTYVEQWKEQNPGQALDIGLYLGANGNARAVAALKMLSGETRTAAFDLPNGVSWIDLIRENLEALQQGEPGDAEESRSWLA